MFRMLSLSFALILLVVATICSAQDSRLDLRRDAAPRGGVVQDNTAGVVSPTPEMWFYEQERNRYEDPKSAVRRRAELRGMQRAERLASMQWYGFSNSRPTVNATPLFGSYSPHWGSNTADAFRWRSAPYVVQRPGNSTY